MNFVEQLTAIALLIDFLFEVTCGVIINTGSNPERGGRSWTSEGF